MSIAILGFRKSPVIELSVWLRQATYETWAIGIATFFSTKIFAAGTGASCAVKFETARTLPKEHSTRDGSLIGAEAIIDAVAATSQSYFRALTPPNPRPVRQGRARRYRENLGLAQVHLP